MDRLDRIARLAATAGGKAALTHFRNADLRVESKGAWHNVVTEGDTDSQDSILPILERQRPDDRIVAEESGYSREGSTGIAWFVDPIDSTANYARGIPGWSVSVGATRHGQPFAGAVYDPVSDEVVSGQVGEGVYVNDRPVVRPKAAPDVLSATVYLCTNQTAGPVREVVAAWFSASGRVRAPGSPALGLAVTAVGRYDVAVIVGLVNDWDVTAGLALCDAAGLSTLVTSMGTGERVIVAATEHLFDQAVEITVTACGGRQALV